MGGRRGLTIPSRGRGETGSGTDGKQDVLDFAPTHLERSPTLTGKVVLWGMSPSSRPAGFPSKLVLPCPPPGLASPVCGVAGSRSLDSATLGAVRTEEIDDLASPFEEKTLQEDGCPCLDQLSAQADPVSK